MRMRRMYYGVAVALFLAFVLFLVQMIFLLTGRNVRDEVAPAVYATGGWEGWADDHTALTTALFWEGDMHESEAGLRAIAWVIRNRVRSRDFPRDKSLPNTIRGVVIDGYHLGQREGCQFSFVCNGAGESPEEFIRLQERIGVGLTLEESKRRWAEYSRIAAEFLRDPGRDLTKGANHYWAATIADPYWVRVDVEPSSRIRIGSHWFGWSRVLGEDVGLKKEIRG